MKKFILTFLFLSTAGLLHAAQSGQYQLNEYLFNTAGNTQTGQAQNHSMRLHISSMGEAAVGQNYSNQTSTQAGFFNNYFIAKPTPTVTPTVTVTATPIRSFNGELLDKQYVYPAPHPIRGPEAHIHYHLAEPAKVEIKIYTTGHRLVIEKQWDSMPAGENIWNWNVSNMANGVYLMLIKASNEGKTTKLIKKLAIIK